jgi:hypothetical protein
MSVLKSTPKDILSPTPLGVESGVGGLGYSFFYKYLIPIEIISNHFIKKHEQNS